MSHFTARQADNFDGLDDDCRGFFADIKLTLDQFDVCNCVVDIHA